MKCYLLPPSANLDGLLLDCSETLVRHSFVASGDGLSPLGHKATRGGHPRGGCFIFEFRRQLRKMNRQRDVFFERMFPGNRFRFVHQCQPFAKWVCYRISSVLMSTKNQFTPHRYLPAKPLEQLSTSAVKVTPSDALASTPRRSPPRPRWRPQQSAQKRQQSGFSRGDLPLVQPAPVHSGGCWVLGAWIACRTDQVGATPAFPTSACLARTDPHGIQLPASFTFFEPRQMLNYPRGGGSCGPAPAFDVRRVSGFRWSAPPPRARPAKGGSGPTVWGY